MALFSIAFVAFVTITVIIYYLVPQKIQWIVLLLASLAFYLISGSWKGLIFIVITVVSTFFCTSRMDRINEQQKIDMAPADRKLTRDEKKAIKAKASRTKKKYMLLGILLNFGILGVLKYTNFVTENISKLLGAFNLGQIQPVHFLLPLGISFYTFQTMGYLLDVYRGRAAAEKNIFKFALFTTYFPQIIQGPISKHDQLAPELEKGHDFDPVGFREGVMRFLWGCFKKVVIADRAAVIANYVIDNFYGEHLQGFTVFTGLIFYGIQMYGDFSGGIDMTIGVSNMLGINMMENFRQPYMSRTISEFWNRWHISLGEWMKNYIFYPLALSKSFSNLQKKMKKKIGNYYGKVIPSVIASIIVFVVVGIWHGAAWKYVAFGIFHGVLTAADTFFEKISTDTRNFLHIDGESLAWKLFQMARTLFLVTIGRYLDCADGLRTSLRMLKETFTHFNPWVLTDGTFLNMGVSQKQMYWLILAVLLLAAVDIVNEKGIVLRSIFARQGIVFRWMLYIVALLVILLLGAYGPGYNAAAFIYQGF